MPVVFNLRKGHKVMLRYVMEWFSKQHSNLGREATRTFYMANGFLIRYTHNNKRRYRGFCRVQICPWKMIDSAVASGSVFKVRTYVDIHYCERKYMNKRATSSWIAAR